MAGTSDTCGRKHLSWALGTLAACGVLFGTLASLSTGKAAQEDVQAIELRVRSMEQNQVRLEERLMRVQDDVQWIRSKMEARQPGQGGQP